MNRSTPKAKSTTISLYPLKFEDVIRAVAIMKPLPKSAKKPKRAGHSKPK